MADMAINGNGKGPIACQSCALGHFLKSDLLLDNNYTIVCGYISKRLLPLTLIS